MRLRDGRRPGLSGAMFPKEEHRSFEEELANAQRDGRDDAAPEATDGSVVIQGPGGSVEVIQGPGGSIEVAMAMMEMQRNIRELAEIVGTQEARIRGMEDSMSSVMCKGGRSA